jgi:hypothetical protein
MRAPARRRHSRENPQEIWSDSSVLEPHGCRVAANRIDMYQRLLAFFDRDLEAPVASAR